MAVTEALVNALIYRDYIVAGSEVHIDMYDDRLEIQSPGGMFEGKPIQECDINAIGSVRRNPVIADLFHRMKFMERRGSGLKKILSETEKLPGYSEELKPEFFSTPSDFRVVLKNINHIISLLEFCSIARTRDEMQEYFGVSSREYFRKNILKPLLEAKQLVMTIPDKPKSKYQKYITSQKLSIICKKAPLLQHVVKGCFFVLYIGHRFSI